jgi:NADH-quinone oxidoreductase subunit L
MHTAISFLVIIPLLGFLLSLIPNNSQEKWLYRIALSTLISHGLLGTIITAYWLIKGAVPFSMHGVGLYDQAQTHISLDFYFDAITSVYGIVSTAITFFVIIFSKTYLHREKGFKRFFNNLLFFYLGLNLIMFAGNFETLFVGWEFIGIASFLLISFYRDRYLPVKNGLKVLSIYRIADVSLLVGIWLCHHAFQTSISFHDMHHYGAHHDWFPTHPELQWIIPSVFLIAAMIKSAQFPFSYWLPRAMEGPTSSSAIFYGSLSVHIGLLLLMRLYPFWDSSLIFQSILFLIGLVTSITSALSARVQSTVKTQIAYSSIAQIGIMFMEVALGWFEFALFHFMCNAFLRTYQLLVSPSVLNYVMHDQFFTFTQPDTKLSNSFSDRIKATVYVLAFNEWNLDHFMYNQLWLRLKWMGKKCHFLLGNYFLLVIGLLYCAALYLLYHDDKPSDITHTYQTYFWVVMGIALVLAGFVERESAERSLVSIVVSQTCVAMAIAYNERFDFNEVHLYLSGILLCGVIALVCLRILKSKEEQFSLQRFYGHSFEYPKISILFLVACLGISGFPITPTFIGEDLLISHIHLHQTGLLLLVIFALLINGIVAYRIYARVFLGQHIKVTHEVALRSA